MRNYTQKLLLAVFITLMFLLSLGRSNGLTWWQDGYNSYSFAIVLFFILDRDGTGDTVEDGKEIYCCSLWNEMIFYGCCFITKLLRRSHIVGWRLAVDGSDSLLDSFVCWWNE